MSEKARSLKEWLKQRRSQGLWTQTGNFVEQMEDARCLSCWKSPCHQKHLFILFNYIMYIELGLLQYTGTAFQAKSSTDSDNICPFALTGGLRSGQACLSPDPVPNSNSP
jgi:hypothetical protein